MVSKSSVQENRIVGCLGPEELEMLILHIKHVLVNGDVGFERVNQLGSIEIHCRSIRTQEVRMCTPAVRRLLISVASCLGRSRRGSIRRPQTKTEKTKEGKTPGMDPVLVCDPTPVTIHRDTVYLVPVPPKTIHPFINDLVRRSQQHFALLFHNNTWVSLIWRKPIGI